MSEPFALLIVGGGPAGLAAARAYRQADGSGQVAIITDEHRIPYARPPLTKDLLRGESVIADLPIEPEAFFDENHIELIGGRAVSLDAGERIVALSGGRQLEYTRCLLSTGAEPKRLPVRGADHPRVTAMRNLDDFHRLEEHLGGKPEMVVIGSGFIACEIAASLSSTGYAVDLVSDEEAPNIRRLGADAAKLIGVWLADAGVRLQLGTPVDHVEHRDGLCIVSAGEWRVEADLVLMATGVAPRGELALAAGLELDAGAIPVDSGMRTSIDGLLAAGDVAKADNEVAGRAVRVEHWGDALGQGAIAGRTAADVAARWDAVPGFWSTIGEHTLKYVAWGDGYDQSSIRRHVNGGFTVRYGADGKLVGVLTNRADEDYDRGQTEIAEGVSWSD